MTIHRLHPRWRGLVMPSVALIALLALSACGGLRPRPTPTPTRTPRLAPIATATPIPPSPTPTDLPTATPLPPATDTPISPTDTPTLPANTPVAESGSMGGPVPTFTPTGTGGQASGGEVWLLPPPFGPVPQVAPLPDLPPRPANINPLTGLEVDPAKLALRPLHVCINNDPQARPQYGFAQADLVYEYVMESYFITRFTAVFWGQEAERIGPVRSARLINAELTAQFDGLLACSGGSDMVRWILKHKVSFPYLDGDLDDPGNNRYFYNVGTDYRTRLQTSTAGLRKWLADKGLEKAVQVRGFLFATDVPAGGNPATSIHIPYPKFTRLNNEVDWTYDAGRGRYLRQMAGEPHVDAASGEQLSAANVVVQFAEHTDTDIKEDSLGSLSIRIELWGEGKALVFRDGQVFEAIWRSQPDKNTAYLFPDGRPIPFKPGNTWFEIVPTDYKVTYK